MSNLYNRIRPKDAPPPVAKSAPVATSAPVAKVIEHVPATPAPPQFDGPKVRVNMLLPQDMVDALKVKCEAQGTTMAAVGRQLFEEFLK